MSEVLKKARKNKIWYLLHVSTGYSTTYCKKVIKNERNQDAKGAQIIVKKYKEICKILNNDSK